MITGPILLIQLDRTQDQAETQSNPCNPRVLGLFVWVEFNAPPDTIYVISGAVFTANHFDDYDDDDDDDDDDDEYCNERVCLSVCVCVRDHVSGNKHPIFTNFVTHVTYGRGSVLLWRRSDTLRISGFVDDVIFADISWLAAWHRCQAEAERLTRSLRLGA